MSKTKKGSFVPNCFDLRPKNWTGSQPTRSRVADKFRRPDAAQVKEYALAHLRAIVARCAKHEAVCDTYSSRYARS